MATTKPSRSDRRAAKRAAKAGRPSLVARSKAQVGQLTQAWKLTKEHDPKLPLFVLGTFALVFALMIVLGALVGPLWLWATFGLLLGVMLATIVFGRRAQTAAYNQVEGQVGAAAGVLQSMRGNWRVTPAVAFTAQQDMVHRVIGRPGIVLIAEGTSSRVGQLLGQEKKRSGRVAGSEVPVYDVLVGDGEGQVSLRKLSKHLQKLPRNIKPASVNELDRRFAAMKTTMPIPKGPMPTRVPRGKVR